MSGRHIRRLASLVLAVIFLESMALWAAGPTINPIDPTQRQELITLLSVLDQLVMKGPRDSEVFKSYQTVRNQMQAGRINFIVDAKSTNTSLIRSAYFSPNTKGISVIMADPVLLKAAKSQPSLALTLLMNAFVMADSFYGDQINFSSL